MISDGPVPLASRSQKFLGDAQYSGPSPSLCPSSEATTCCKRGSSCVLSIPESKETGCPGSDVPLSVECSLDAVWTRAGLGAPLCTRHFQGLCERVNGLEASQFRPPHQVITPSPRGHLTGVAGSRRSQDEALPGGRVPPPLSTPGLTETRVPAGPGAPPSFHSQRSTCGLKKQGPQKTKQNKSYGFPYRWPQEAEMLECSQLAADTD